MIITVLFFEKFIEMVENKMGVSRGVRGRKHNFSAAFQIIFKIDQKLHYFPFSPRSQTNFISAKGFLKPNICLTLCKILVSWMWGQREGKVRRTKISNLNFDSRQR